MELVIYFQRLTEPSRMQQLIERMKKSPIENMSPEMKKKLTPERLKVMNCCGMSYLVIVILLMFWSSVFVSMPVVYAENPNTLFYRRIFVVYIFIVSVINLYLLTVKNSYFSSDEGMQILPNISWKKCIDCNVEAPPRSHHCPLCHRCVLKRDHHCFFTGTCVGFRNQRYFIVFSTYSTLGSLYASYLMYSYLLQVYTNDTYRFYDYILPVASVQALGGYQSFTFLVTLLMEYINIITFLGSLSQIAIQVFIVGQGLTTHEYTSNIHTYRTRHILKNYRAVLGPYWPIHFLIPLPWLKVEGDGLTFEAKIM